ncbi:MAG: hemin uptake protein HemP [Rhodobacteraceae bacterium]|jgi:hemin uptake protein HemP|nr:hemin uptake protein HemP [Paracoccaceae bacterium]
MTRHTTDFHRESASYGPPASTPVHVAETLTAGGSTAFILLNGQQYTLRITRQGKLILTK